MFLKKKLEATKNCYPVYPPKLPTIEELEKSSTPTKDMDEYFKSHEAAREQTNKNFENALARIKLCDYLYGMTHFHFFTPYNFFQKRNHYYWCPQNKWDEYNNFIKNNPLNIQK